MWNHIWLRRKRNSLKPNLNATSLFYDQRCVTCFWVKVFNIKIISVFKRNKIHTNIKIIVNGKSQIYSLYYTTGWQSGLYWLCFFSFSLFKVICKFRKQSLQLFFIWKYQISFNLMYLISHAGEMRNFLVDKDSYVINSKVNNEHFTSSCLLIKYIIMCTIE